MRKNINLTKLLLPHAQRKMWVVLSPDKKRVIGKGKSINEALGEAEKEKVKNPILIQAIPDYSGFAPFLK